MGGPTTLVTTTAHAEAHPPRLSLTTCTPTPPTTPGFSAADFSWPAYSQHRPAYPPSLWTHLLTYHASHAGALTAAHDMGAGAGPCAAMLAHHFATVHVSDAVAANLAAARAHLTDPAFTARLPRPVRLAFAHARGEDQAWLPRASVDMLTVCEALHWMDPVHTLRAAARVVRPRGTFAAVHYSLKPWIRGPTAARANALLSALFRQRLLCAARASAVQRCANAFGAAGLDYVPLDPAEWKDVTRLYINVGRGDASFAEWREGNVAASAVGDGEAQIALSDEEGWAREVDGAWFEGYFASLQIGLETLAPGGDEWETLQEFRACVAGRRVTVVWPVAVLLASRR